MTSPLNQQIDVIYCAKGSICSRRSKATVLSRRENKVIQSYLLNDAFMVPGALNITNKNHIPCQKELFDNSSYEGELNIFYWIGKKTQFK